MTKSLLVNLIVAPTLAYLLVRTIPMAPSYAAGVVLLAVAPGAPYGPKLAEISDSDLAFASGLLVVLAVVSVATIMVSLALLLPGSVTVDPFAIGRLVFGVQLVPLLAGLAVAALATPVADVLYTSVQRLSDYSFALLIVVLLVAYLDDMMTLVGTDALAASSVAVVGSLLVGYALGGPRRSTREVLATTTAARNAAIALFVATAGFSDPRPHRCSGFLVPRCCLISADCSEVAAPFSVNSGSELGAGPTQSCLGDGVLSLVLSRVAPRDSVPWGASSRTSRRPIGFRQSRLHP